MNNLWVWVLALATPFAITYVLILSKWRFSKLVTLSLAGIFIVAITIINFITIRDMAWMVVERPILDLACRLFNILIEMAITFIITKQSRAQSAFILLSICLCVYIVDTISITIDLLSGSVLAEFIFKLALYLFIAAVLLRLRKTFWEIALYMKNRLWMLCIVQAVLFACATMIISFPVPLSLAPVNIPLALMIGIANVMVYGIFIYIFKLIRRQSALESSERAFHIYTASLEQQNELISKNAEKAAMFRHDIRHVAQMINVCAEKKDIDGIMKLTKHLYVNTSEKMGLVKVEITKHNMLDIILNSYISLARESNIEILVSVTSIEPLSVNLIEFAVVLANALENAVNACKKQPPYEKRVIQVDGRKRGRQFFLEVANTFSGEVKFNLSTGLPVSSEEGHGTGVKSIAYFAEKSGAELFYRADGNWFHMGMLLNL